MVTASIKLMATSELHITHNNNIVTKYVQLGFNPKRSIIGGKYSSHHI